MSDYNKEQAEALTMVCAHLASVSPGERASLASAVGDYLQFRGDVDAFLSDYFGDVCTKSCYESQRSACCSREGIITFFADVVINALVSHGTEIEQLGNALEKGGHSNKCVYLGSQGCLWRVKPIVCEMFLCDAAKKEVFSTKPAAGSEWDRLKQREKQFRWPDRPVLFDELERIFIHAGFSSSLMYLHNSPGLLRVKRLSMSKDNDE